MFLSASTHGQSTESESWGAVKGKEVTLYTITNKNGMKMQIMNLGCIITSLFVPDKIGHLDDVVLGFDNLKDYLSDHPSFGTTVGRYANRIRNAEFVLNDTLYKLTANDSGRTLHGAMSFEMPFGMPLPLPPLKDRESNLTTFHPTGRLASLET